MKSLFELIEPYIGDFRCYLLPCDHYATTDLLANGSIICPICGAEYFDKPMSDSMSNASIIENIIESYLQKFNYQKRQKNA